MQKFFTDFRIVIKMPFCFLYIEKKFLCGSFAAGMDEIKKYPEGLEKNSGIFMRIFEHKKIIWNDCGFQEGKKQNMQPDRFRHADAAYI